VYFVSQNPMDVPDQVLGQIGNRVQHALRAFTPRDQKAVRAAAQTFRTNPNLDVEVAITQLGVGEALISLLEAQGTPGIVQRAFIRPPESRVGPITPDERQKVISTSVIFGHYENAIDRESAYELLKGRAEAAANAAVEAQPEPPPPPRRTGAIRMTPPPQLPTARRSVGRAPSQRESMSEAMMKSAVRAAGSQIGRQLFRGVLGSLLGGRR